MMRIHVAILAAGQSLRYGSEDKLSEQVGGKSLLTILLEKIQRISAPWKGCTVLVVSRELAKLCTDGPEICVVNGDPKRGISHSIQLALDVVQNSPHWMPGDAVCFCVCDQPFLKQGTLENMLEGYLKSGKGIGCIDRGGPKQIAWIRHCFAYTWFIAIVSELISCIGFRLIQLTVYKGGANQ